MCQQRLRRAQGQRRAGQPGQRPQRHGRAGLAHHDQAGLGRSVTLEHPPQVIDRRTGRRLAHRRRARHPQQRRQRQPVLVGDRQQFARPGPARQHHRPGGHEHRRRVEALAPQTGDLQLHQPARPGRLQRPGLDPQKQPRPVGRCHRQVPRGQPVCRRPARGGRLLGCARQRRGLHPHLGQRRHQPVLAMLALLAVALAQPSRPARILEQPRRRLQRAAVLPRVLGDRAPFQHHHPLARARQPAGRHRAGQVGAQHQHLGLGGQQPERGRLHVAVRAPIRCRNCNISGNVSRSQSLPMNRSWCPYPGISTYS